MDFLNQIVDGKAVSETVSGLYSQVAAEGGTVKTLWDAGMGFVESILPFAWILPAILAVLSLVEVFAGKKLLGLQKILGCFVVGFACGATFLAPVVATLVAIDAWIVGLVVGVVAALLCKPVYFIAYVVAAVAAPFYVCMSGLIPVAFLQNWIVALVIGVVVAVLAVIFRKWFEMVGTAALGAFLLVLCVDAFTIMFLGGIFIPVLRYAIMGVVALAGAIVQIATRRRW